MLDVVEIQHDIVTHRQPEVQFFQLLTRRAMACIGRIEIGNAVPQRRTVDAHEVESEAICHVLHQVVLP